MSSPNLSFIPETFSEKIDPEMKECIFLNMIGAKLCDQSMQAVSNFVQQLPVATLPGSKPGRAPNLLNLKRPSSYPSTVPISTRT